LWRIQFLVMSLNILVLSARGCEYKFITKDGIILKKTVDINKKTEIICRIKMYYY
jgi:hypothetical protein